MLGQVLQKAGQREHAAEALRSAQELSRKQKDTTLANAYVIEGAKLLERGQATEAGAKFQQALRLNPDDLLAQYDYGVALLLEDRLDEAIEHFHIVLAAKPDDPDANYYAGRAFLAKNQPAEAVTYLQEAVKAKPDDSHAHNALAVALAGIKEFPTALSELRAARRLAPDNPLFDQNLRCLEKRLEDCTLSP
jgi:Flp pilus assembly protein TadD